MSGSLLARLRRSAVEPEASDAPTDAPKDAPADAPQDAPTDAPADVPAASESDVPGRSRLRRVAGRVLTVAAVLLIFLAMILPNIISRFERPGTYFRLPIEGFVAIGVLALLPGKWKRIVAGVLGAGLGLLTVEKILDMGFYEVLARPFDPVLDWVLFDDAEAFLRDSAGQAGAIGALIAVIVLVLAVLALMTLAALRIARLVAAHRKATARTALAGTALWVVFLVLGVQVFNQIPVSSRSTIQYAWDRAHSVKRGLNDEKNFAREVKVDAFAQTPADQLLTSLRGKDVLFTFVESYGRSAIEDPALAPDTVNVLDVGTEKLKKAGFASRSGFLTSPTAGGGSWLAHSTLLSGLWIDKQSRYRNLTSSTRLTLTSLFRKADFNTVSVMPGTTRAWPEGNFYGYNKVYDTRNMGYAGPSFAWSPQPDQYTLSWLQKNLNTPGHAPMMIEMPLVSSHTPWAPIPEYIDWDQVGDGSIYKDIQKRGKRAGSVWKDPAKVKQEYSRSIQYTLTTLISYMRTYGDEKTVMVFLGDHQPAPIVVGDNASRDVPITIIAKDPAVLDKISDWGWQDGLRPRPDAPVMPMSAFRDKFLTAFGPDQEPNRALAPPTR